MKKNRTKILIITTILITISLFLIVFLLSQKEDESMDGLGLDRVRELLVSDLDELKNGKYSNLIYHEFNFSLDDVKGVYKLEIESDNSYQERTFIENFEIMKGVIDRFFNDDFDKSYIVADFPFEDGTEYIGFNEITSKCADEKYNTDGITYLFGNNTSEGGYMVQISESLINTWFSRFGLGSIMPSQLEIKNAYTYIAGNRQGEDVMLNLKDGTISLSTMEEKVLAFLNQNFPMPVSDGITFGIGEARVLDNGEYDGVSFKARRIYKGVPFEYGSNISTGMYIDKYESDCGEVAYAESSEPDTMLAFGNINGTVVETECISKILTVGDALNILSEQVGDNSVYDVYGIELVYRDDDIPEEKKDEIDDILVPKWKIITVNQNDDKYTMFYVDVVSGEITERFEYYYGN